MITTNQTKKILTIAVPVYNTEKYLTKCLDSVLTCKNKKEIEVLVINDGSPDGADVLLTRYSQQNPKIVRYIKKLNGGWGTCINLAITEAKGKYFKILDSDDYYDTPALDSFVEYLKGIDADLLISSMTEIYENNNLKSIDIRPELAYKTLSASEHFKICAFPMHMLCYKTVLLSSNSIRMSERFYSDIEFILKPLMHIRTVSYVPYNVYQYLRVRGDASTATRNYAVNRRNFLAVAKSLVSYYSIHKENMTAELDSVFCKNIVSVCRMVYELHLSRTYQFANVPCDLADLRSFEQFLAEHSPNILKTLHRIRKKGMPYIWIWSKLHFNVLNIGRCSFFRKQQIENV